MQSQVEKFKILPRAKTASKGDEETKGEEPKKVTMGRGLFSLETAEVKEGQPVFVVVFRNLIGKTLYQGTISSQHSKKRRIEEKAMKMQLKVALMSKDGSTQKFKVDHCVVSFARSEDMKDFETKFEEALLKLKK